MHLITIIKPALSANRVATYTIVIAQNSQACTHNDRTTIRGEDV